MFCHVNNMEHLGVAKVVDITNKQWTIEYFDAPGYPLETRCVSQSSIVRKILGFNTRIYHHDHVTDHWMVGRVLQDDGEGIYVRFTDHVDKYLNYKEVFVRWKKPISDPTTYLAKFITETPQYSEDRSKFLQSYIDQRSASWGLSSLMSSVIDHEAHQINVVRRVLNDASQRYLLADEVGLGKTIEAGVLIRQAVLDDPRGHKIVVVVPAILVQQWRGELIRRFGLEDYLDESVFVISQEISANLTQVLTGTTFLIIDEAHHIASGIDPESRDMYELIRKAAMTVERLLLLSATPVIRNETGFLRMLHLLDPVVYNLSDEAAFRSKIQHRQALAETVAMLDPQNVLCLDEVLEDLLVKLPNDDRLRELVNALQSQLLGFPDEDDLELCQSIRSLRAHLSETYRLHRRILRNRRKNVSDLTPDRSGSIAWISASTQTCCLESLLESWRIDAVATHSMDGSGTAREALRLFYWQSVSALLENPAKLMTVCQERIAMTRMSPDNLAFKGELELLEELCSLIDVEEWYSDRLRCLEYQLQQLRGTKVVIFCSCKESANKVFYHLKCGLGPVVIRHGTSENTGYDAASEFMNNPAVAVIVCDHTAEEGINLQGGDKTIIHFDLPIEPNRIEQRIGRVDRYCFGTPISSVVMLDEGALYQRSWYAVLNEGLGVFDRSISSLQYLVEDELQRLRVRLLDEGVEVMGEMVRDLGGPSGAVSKELKLIDEQDGLDELSQVAESEFETLSDCDGDWKDIREAAVSWAVNTLLFEQIAEPVTDMQKSKDHPYRFKYIKPGGGGKGTLIPLSGFLDDFVGIIDFAAHGSTSNTPLSYSHSAHRTTAVKRGTRLLRYGDEFIEAVKSFSDIDDRGRSFALWRQMHDGFSDGGTPSIFFRFDFLIETRLDEAESVLSSSSTRGNVSAGSILARRGDMLFPPSVAHVWIDEDGEEVGQDVVEEFLTLPFRKFGVPGHYIDKNLKLHRLLSLKNFMPDTFENWGERCRRMRDKAHSILQLRQELIDRKKTALRLAQTEDEIRYAQLTTRIRHLEGKEAESEREQFALERKINEALYLGIQTPNIKVDVAGVIFLSHQPFSSIEGGNFI